MMLGPIPRGLLAAFLCLCVLAILMTARALFEARAQRAHAELALQAGDLEGAVTALRRAARWNAPGNVYARDALVSLERIAEQARTRGEPALELSAYRSIHAAIHAASGAYTYERERLERADRHIAELMAREPPGELELQRTPGERRQHYLTLLQAEQPRAGWVLFACAGFATWVVAASVFLLRGVDARGRVVRRVARRSGLALLLGWIAFALGLRFA